MKDNDSFQGKIVRLSGVEVRSGMLGVLAGHKATSQAVHALRMERQCLAGPKRPTEHAVFVQLSWKSMRFLLVHGRLQLSLLHGQPDHELRLLFEAVLGYLKRKLETGSPSVLVMTLPEPWMAELMNRECWSELQLPWFEQDVYRILRDIGEIRTLLALKKVKVFFQPLKGHKISPKALNYAVFSFRTIGIATKPLEKQSLCGLLSALPEGFHTTRHLGRLPGWKGLKTHE